MRPADLPPADRYAHGTHARYVSGCRCDSCRAGHTAYARERARARRRGDWNGLVDTTAARKHLLALSRQGVGRRAVSAACDIGLTTLGEIRTGQKKLIRARTAKKILAVTKDARSDCSLVSAKRTWQRIETLLDEGFSKAELARRLGWKHSIQLKRDRITARNAHRVARFYRSVME